MQTDMFYGATPAIFANAKQLRKTMTLAEGLLWNKLRRGQLGYRFKAQHPVSYFIADFYCHQAKLIVEVDGSVHDIAEQIEYDAGRTYILEEFNLTVVRFRNEEIEDNLAQVLTQISQLLPTNFK